MFTPQEIFEKSIEFAELEYLSARNRGVPSPVIELDGSDAEDPEKVTVTVWQRQNLVGSLRTRGERGIGAAKSLDHPEQPGTFSVIVVAAQGIYAFPKMPIQNPLGPMPDVPGDA